MGIICDLPGTQKRIVGQEKRNESNSKNNILHFPYEFITNEF